MKNKKVTMKKLIAAVMSVAVIATSIYFMPQTDASATDTTVQKQSYGAWKDTVPVNGSFEVGEEGMDVYGWSLISTTSARTVKHTNPDAYRDNFHLLTVVEGNGNKVAELAKDGTGYMAMISQEISVTASKDYNLSIDYNVKDISIDIDPTTGVEYTSNKTVYRLSFYVEEIDAKGNSTITEQLQNGSNKESYGWETFNLQFKTKESTEKIIVYCWLGGELHVNETVWLDNIELSEYDDYAVINGDFDKTTYQADGGRTVGIAGPAGWTLTGFTDSTEGINPDTENHSFTTKWNNNFAVTTADIDDRSVAAFGNVETATAGGYVLLQSSMIPVNGVQTCDVAAECKLVCYNNDGTDALTESLTRQGIYLNLTCYDAEGNCLGDVAGGKITQTLNSDKTAFEWKKMLLADAETVEGTVYVKVGIYLGFARSDMHKFVLYIDNVGLDVNDTSLGYTQYSSGDYGVVKEDIERRPYYGIQKINGGTGYEDAIQLHTTNSSNVNRALYGVLFCSDKISAEAGQKYIIELDMKIEGIADSTKTLGADIVLRSFDEEGNLLERKTLLNANNTDNLAWTHKTFNHTLPAKTVAVEIGFLIGITVTVNSNPDMKHSFANIAIAKADDTTFWDEYDNKRPQTDLLFVTLDTENESTVKDLIDIKKGAGNDMNLSGRINEDDANIMRWKLTGVTKSSELRR